MSFQRLARSKKRASRCQIGLAVEALEMRQLFSVFGIDISSAVSNWSTLKNTDGEQFVYIHASYGGEAGQDSAYFPGDLSGATAAGLAAGAYHFAYPGSSTALAEADYFYSVASSAMKPGNLPPVLDMEETGNDGSSSPSAWVNTFCTELKAKSGVTPIVYTYSSFASDYLNSSVTQWPLWIANDDGSSVTSVPSGPWSSTAWKIHQYQGTTTLSGDSVDLDILSSNTTLAALKIPAANPAISVMQGTTTVTNNGTATNFGFANLNTTVTKTYTITNTAGGTLSLSGLKGTGGFEINTGFGSTSLGAGASTTFIGQMITSSAGSKTGTFTFTTNVTGSTTFTINASGTVVDPTPSPPSNLQITSYNNNSVTLGWSDNSSDETAFLIERKTGAGGTYSQIGSVGSNTTAFTDPTGGTAPAPGTLYYYRVRAANGSYDSAYTTEESVTTLANTPTGIAATDGTLGDRVTITWNAATGATEYQVYRATSAGGTQTAVGAPVSGTSEDDLTATPGTTYYYWVTALNSASVASPEDGPDSGYIAGDTTPPTIVSGSFDEDYQPTTVAFTFSEPVQTLSTSNLSVSNTDGGAAPTVTGYSYNSATNTATFDLSNGLVDGHYQAVLNGVADLAGNALSGANALDFSFLSGDANGDGTVNSSDFAVLAANYGQTGNLKFSQGDFNYDGVVNALDFNALASHFGDTMLPAGSSLATASAMMPGALPASAGPAASLFSNQPISQRVIDLTDSAANGADNGVLS